jgi:murein DD-endopeptidase MepM/ murein hydrolase activator NlpD
MHLWPESPHSISPSPSYPCISTWEGGAWKIYLSLRKALFAGESVYTGKEQLHLGIDIAGHKGTPIMATAKGKVVYVGKWGPLGLKVQIKHSASFSTEYGHLLDAAVKKGQEAGYVIRFFARGPTGE